MSSITIRKISITNLAADAIVNAANDGLWAGGGVCGAIFKAAGHALLQAACDQIGHCDVGSAVITDAFSLQAKYIIHAVGPRYQDGHHSEPDLLYGAYSRSLQLAVENGCTSIAFPLISAGIFGYPIDDAWAVAITACSDYLKKLSGHSLDIIFAVLDDSIYEKGNKVLRHLASDFQSALKDDCIKEQPLTHDTLRMGEKTVEAVFFHKPEEPHGYLSNWYPSPFKLDGIRFTSVEQYIMYHKCKLFGDEESAKAVLATDDVAKQQRIGRNAKGYNNHIWTGIRQVIALRGLMAKFSQNPDLKHQLLQTGNAWLVECAHSDTLWACGIRLNDANRFDASLWRGTNILGFALMEVRTTLREA